MWIKNKRWPQHDASVDPSLPETTARRHIDEKYGHWKDMKNLGYLFIGKKKTTTTKMKMMRKIAQARGMFMCRFENNTDTLSYLMHISIRLIVWSQTRNLIHVQGNIYDIKLQSSIICPYLCLCVWVCVCVCVMCMCNLCIVCGQRWLR